MLAVFDSQFRFVSSWAVSPIQLASIRLLFAFYTLFVVLYTLIFEAITLDGPDIYFSYFTNLTYIGLCSYFFASGVQTFFYARRLKSGERSYPLQSWPRPLRYLHTLLSSTILTFPYLVTIVYWVLLADSTTFDTPYDGWKNISKHALNSAFALFEGILTNLAPMPWIDLPATVVILALYLALAYITHASQGIYPYSFLDPKKKGKTLAAYIVGIAVGQIVVFLIVFGVITLRRKLTLRYVEPAEENTKGEHEGEEAGV